MSLTTLIKNCSYRIIASSMQLHNSSTIKCNFRSDLHNNATKDAFTFSFSTELKVCLYVLYVLIFLFGTIGNSLVCYIIGLKKRRQPSGDIFIVSLAVADLLASVSVPVLMISDMASDFKVWHFGHIGCHILPSISPITLVASSWSLVVISLDRYRAITRPLSFNLSTKLKLFGLLFIWSIAIGACVPYALAHKIDDNFCWAIEFSSPYIATVWCGCFLVTGWIIPLIIMTGLYTRMARKLKVGEKNHANNPGAFNSIQRENRRVVNMFTTIVCAFFLLTMPYSLFYFTLAYLEYAKPDDINFDHLISANYGLFVLTMINSCTNPIIYARMHSKVRVATKTIFGRGQVHPSSEVPNTVEF